MRVGSRRGRRRPPPERDRSATCQARPRPSAARPRRGFGDGADGCGRALSGVPPALYCRRGRRGGPSLGRQDTGLPFRGNRVGLHRGRQYPEIRAGPASNDRCLPFGSWRAHGRAGAPGPGSPACDAAVRALRGVEAGLAAGGEEGRVRSAGMLVADRWTWPIVDLRVDWHEEPIAELRRVWEIYQPQMGDYLTRALDPASAPSYPAAEDV